MATNEHGIASTHIHRRASRHHRQITERLSARDDLCLLTIDAAQRKNPDRKRALFEAADIVVLCLPDDAAREAAALTSNTRIIDASTAHRVDRQWVYGLPELAPGQREAIASAGRVSNPGCYPTGFLLAVRPLVDAGLLPATALVRIHATSGYSGGGKSMIERYENHDEPGWRSRPYALGLNHKHVPEMRYFSGLEQAPLFAPSVGHYYKGMLVQVPLFGRELAGEYRPADLVDVLQQRYADEPFVEVREAQDDSMLDLGLLSPTACNGTNRVELMVFGHADQMLLVARLDNLGKGAAGAAVQNLNIMLGCDEQESLAA